MVCFWIQLYIIYLIICDAIVNELWLFNLSDQWISDRLGSSMHLHALASPDDHMSISCLMVAYLSMACVLLVLLLVSG
jgi:hypothetical protein